jgi:hypothetical protein
MGARGGDGGRWRLVIGDLLSVIGIIRVLNDKKNQVYNYSQIVLLYECEYLMHIPVHGSLITKYKAPGRNPGRTVQIV